MAKVVGKILPRSFIEKTMSKTANYHNELTSQKGEGFNAFSDRIWACYNSAHQVYAEQQTNSMLDDIIDNDVVIANENQNEIASQAKQEAKDRAEDWISSQFALVASAEKYLKKRTWGEIFRHPFRSIAENIAFSKLKKRVYEENSKTPNATKDTLVKVASEFYDAPQNHVKGITPKGTILVEANLGYKKNEETGKREPTKTENISITFDQFKDREKDPEKFDKNIDKFLKQKRREERKIGLAQKENEEILISKQNEEVSEKEQEDLKNNINDDVLGIVDDSKLSPPYNQKQNPTKENTINKD